MTSLYLGDPSKELEVEFIKEGGSFCPYCRSNSISSLGSHRNDPYSFEIECHQCGRRWLEVLELKGLLLDEKASAKDDLSKTRRAFDEVSTMFLDELPHIFQWIHELGFKHTGNGDGSFYDCKHKDCVSSRLMLLNVKELKKELDEEVEDGI